MSLVWEKGDKVFEERSARLLTLFITDAPDADDHFPNDDFFPNVDNLFADIAGEDVDPKISASVATPYVFMFFLFKILPQFLVLASVLHMFCSCADAICLHSARLHDLFHLYYNSHVLSTIFVNKIIW